MLQRFNNICSKKLLQKTMGSRNRLSQNTGEKQNNKTADTCFLQNQPVAPVRRHAP